MRSSKRSLLTLAGLALLFGACSATSFTSTWKAPDAQPIQLKPGDKVVAFVMANSSSMRRAGEANLADELNARGLQGIPGYTLVAEGDVGDEAKAKAAIDASGAVAAVVMRPMGAEKEVSSTPGMYYGGAGYGSFYGGGYYGHGWGGMYDPGQIRTDTYVSIETLVYDLRQNKLVWAGRTRTMNPSNVEGFIKELAGAVGKELRADGVIAAGS
jgi:hypothetical protein